MILHCRKSFLFCEKQPWTKIGPENFDVPMGSYDGAEICELVGLYILHKLTSGENPMFEKEKCGIYQGMSCEGACAHAHVRCALALVRVRAKSILESARNVRACGPFLGVRCAIALLRTFWDKIARKCYILEHPLLLWNIFSCFGSSYSVLEHLILF